MDRQCNKNNSNPATQKKIFLNPVFRAGNRVFFPFLFYILFIRYLHDTLIVSYMGTGCSHGHLLFMDCDNGHQHCTFPVRDERMEIER